MAISSTADNNGKNVSDYDNLAVIKGIGPARQRWLREVLHVRTFGDLAALSPGEVESRLRSEGQVVSHREIQRWIAEARERAEARQPTPSPSEEPSVLEETPADHSATVGEWKPFASFVVEFQARVDDGRTEDRRTAVHYVEADRNETWSGIAGEQLLQWMREQAGEQIQEERETEPSSAETTVDERITAEAVVDERPSEAQPSPQPTVNVNVDRIIAFQPTRSATPRGIGRESRPFSSVIMSDESVTLEVSFELAEPPSADLVREQVTYRAEFRAINLSTRATVDLGSTEPAPLKGGQSEYTATLREVILQPGMYRLRVVTMLNQKGKPVGIGYLEVPLVQIV